MCVRVCDVCVPRVKLIQGLLQGGDPNLKFNLKVKEQGNTAVFTPVPSMSKVDANIWQSFDVDINNRGPSGGLPPGQQKVIQTIVDIALHGVKLNMLCGVAEELTWRCSWGQGP